MLFESKELKPNEKINGDELNFINKIIDVVSDEVGKLLTVEFDFIGKKFDEQNEIIENLIKDVNKLKKDVYELDIKELPLEEPK